MMVKLEQQKINSFIFPQAIDKLLVKYFYFYSDITSFWKEVQTQEVENVLFNTVIIRIEVTSRYVAYYK